MLNLSFDNGSIASISYFSNGSKKVDKEHLEVFCANWVAVVDNFKGLRLYGTKMSRSRSRQDRGHRPEISAFLESVKTGDRAPFRLRKSTKRHWQLLRYWSQFVADGQYSCDSLLTT